MYMCIYVSMYICIHVYPVFCPLQVFSAALTFLERRVLLGRARTRLTRNPVWFSFRFICPCRVSLFEAPPATLLQPTWGFEEDAVLDIALRQAEAANLTACQASWFASPKPFKGAKSTRGGRRGAGVSGVSANGLVWHGRIHVCVPGCVCVAWEFSIQQVLWMQR